MDSLSGKKSVKCSFITYCAVSLFAAWSFSASALNTSASYQDTRALSHSSPVATSTFSAQVEGGGRYLSQEVTISEKTTPATDNLVGEVFSLADRHWTYTRGVGTIPNICKEGYERVGLLCKVEGASFFSKQIPMECAEGLVNSHGLCYKPCADKFSGFGPFCSGNLSDLKREDLPVEVAKQHSEVLDRFNKPGISLKETQTPRIKTDLFFGPNICKLAPAAAASNALFDQFSDKLIGKIDKAIRGDADLDVKNSSGDTLWSVPSLNEFVAYDLSVSPICKDEADKYVANLSVDNSVTVKVSTKMFDSLLDNLGGVDAGVAKVSIYELIPFRVYGSSGVTLGTNFNIESVVLKDKPQFMINGVAHAHQTALSVTPNINFWLGLDAYLRISSLFSFLPDLLQVGGNVDLNVISWQLPYRLKEGVTYDSGIAQLFIDESLDSNFSAGNGQAKPFLKVLGITIDAFKDSDTKKWVGHQENKNLLTRKGTY